MTQTTQNPVEPTIVYGSGRKPDAAIPRPGWNSAKGTSALSSPIHKTTSSVPRESLGVLSARALPATGRSRISAVVRHGQELDIPVFISPHYYYPHDHQWEFEGALEQLMHDIKMFDRPGPLDTTSSRDQEPTGWSNTSH